MILTGFFPLMSAGFLEVMDTNLKECAELSNCLKMWSQRDWVGACSPDAAGVLPLRMLTLSTDAASVLPLRTLTLSRVKLTRLAGCIGASSLLRPNP